MEMMEIEKAKWIAMILPKPNPRFGFRSGQEMAIPYPSDDFATGLEFSEVALRSFPGGCMCLWTSERIFAWRGFVLT